MPSRRPSVASASSKPRASRARRALAGELVAPWEVGTMTQLGYSIRPFGCRGVLQLHFAERALSFERP